MKLINIININIINYKICIIMFMLCFLFMIKTWLEKMIDKWLKFKKYSKNHSSEFSIILQILLNPETKHLNIKEIFHNKIIF